MGDSTLPKVLASGQTHRLSPEAKRLSGNLSPTTYPAIRDLTRFGTIRGLTRFGTATGRLPALPFSERVRWVLGGMIHGRCPLGGEFESPAQWPGGCGQDVCTSSRQSSSSGATHPSGSNIHLRFTKIADRCPPSVRARGLRPLRGRLELLGGVFCRPRASLRSALGVLSGVDH